MQRRFFPIYLLLALAWCLSQALAQDSGPPQLAAVSNLQPLLDGKRAVTVDAGEGVSLELTAPQPYRQDLAVVADGKKLLTLKGGRFLEFGRIETDPARYWVIAEFTGGAHCCGQYTFLVKAAGQPVRFLGKTAGYNGGPMPLKRSFIFRGGQLYFRSFDNRFDYFHTSHAGSRLVNVPPTYYLLTPTALTIQNSPFKMVYLSDAAIVENEIQRQLSAERSKPEAILKPGFGSGLENMQFSDTLAQLLVKRTILLLYAREDQRAWQGLANDVQQYYQTTRWLPEIKREIWAKLQKHPY